MKKPSFIVMLCCCGLLTALPAQSVNFVSSNLPIVVLDTDGQVIPDKEKIIAHMGIIYNGEGQRNYLTDDYNEYDGRIAIELRGSSSIQFPKKQYALETQDSLGNNLNVPLLGMPEENDWVLYAPYSDKSLMRNVLAYQLAWDLGWYASRTRYCELILNGDYRGVYVLMEKIKRDRNRVDISTLNPEEITGDDLTGGYIVKVDKLAGENIDGWTSPFPPETGSNYRIFYQYHYPKPDEIVPEQQTYIKDMVTNFEAKMFGPGFDDPVTGYSQYILVESFIDVIILTEIGKNVDGYRLSAYMYKDKESTGNRFVAGPIWDFNLAFGNANYYSGGSTGGWQITINSLSEFRSDPFKVPFWWEKLFNESLFANRLNCRWFWLRANVLSGSRIFSFIDSLAVVLDEAQQRNFIRWRILDEYVWPNQVWLGTYANEVSYLKKWIETRLIWLDQNMPGNCTSSVKPDVAISPDFFTLEQNYPNPFNGTTVIPFTMPAAAEPRITIYDLAGKSVRAFDLRTFPAGQGFLVWDGRDTMGRDLSSGIYFYRFVFDQNKQVTKRMLLIR